MIKARALDANELMPGEVFAFFQFVNGTAVRAFGCAGFSDIQVDLGVTVPDFHTRQGAGAKHATLVVQVGGQEFNGGFSHLKLW
jgi:hypothetical protein